MLAAADSWVIRPAAMAPGSPVLDGLGSWTRPSRSACARWLAHGELCLLPQCNRCLPVVCTAAPAPATPPEAHARAQGPVISADTFDCVVEVSECPTAHLDRLGQEQTMTPRQPFEALLGALNAREELAELKGQQAHRRRQSSGPAPMIPAWTVSTGTLIHASTGHGSNGDLTWDAGHRGVVREQVLSASAQAPLGQVVMVATRGRVRMALRNKAEEVHDLGFDEVGHRVLRGDSTEKTVEPETRAPPVSGRSGGPHTYGAGETAR